MFSWGANSYGQLCLGHQEDILTPENLTERQPEQIRTVTGGGGHTAVITVSGKLFTCGWNNKGQLGVGDDSDKFKLQHVKSIPAVISVVCGWNHTLAITAGGKLYVWGSNAFGQLGTGKSVTQQIHPIICEAIQDKEVVAVAAGLRHSLAVLKNGSVWSWGNNKRGQLGTNSISSSGNVYEPVQGDLFKVWGLQSKQYECRKHLPHLSHHSPLTISWVSRCGMISPFNSIPDGCFAVHLPEHEIALKVAAGSYHSAVLTQSGRIYCWGSNQHGQCGKRPDTSCDPPGQGAQPPGSCDPPVKRMPNHSQFCSPQLIGGLLTDTKVIDLCSGWSHLVAVSDKRQAFSWGRADYGQLGRGDGLVHSGYSCEPKEVAGLAHVEQLACGAEHNMVLNGSGELLTWGWNEHGICGTGDETNCHVPTLVPRLRNSRVHVIGCGGGHSFAVIEKDS